MAPLRHSSTVTTGTSPSSDSAFVNDISRSISTTTDTSTTPINTTTTQPTTTHLATTKPTATSHNANKSQPPSPSSPSLISHLQPLLSTTLKTLYHTHRLLLSLLFSNLTLLFLQCFSLFSSVLHLAILTTSFATKLVLYRSLIFLRTAIMETASLTWSIWDSRKARQIRKKIEFEFFVWILGPGGNLLCFLLWPGWLVLGVMVWAVSCALSGVSTAVVSG